MGYTFSKANAEKKEYEKIPDGDYEAVVDSLKEATTKNGKEKIAISFKIRDDVEQPCKGRLVWDDIWKEKDDPSQYNHLRLDQLIGTQHVEDGTSFETVDEIARVMVGAFLIIHVKNETDEWQGVSYERTRVKYYKSTKHPAQTLSAPQKGNTASIEIDDDDMPF